LHPLYCTEERDSQETEARPAGAAASGSGTNFSPRGTMSAFQEYAESLEKHEFMMGTARGRLAVTMDILTDALVLAGQHGVYMQTETKSKRIPRDIEMMIKGIEQAKELVFSVIEELKREKEEKQSLGS
jgi:hypothetical protein